jgi:hypothetical protein
VHCVLGTKVQRDNPRVVVRRRPTINESVEGARVYPSWCAQAHHPRRHSPRGEARSWWREIMPHGKGRIVLRSIEEFHHRATENTEIADKNPTSSTAFLCCSVRSVALHRPMPCGAGAIRKRDAMQRTGSPDCPGGHGFPCRLPFEFVPPSPRFGDTAWQLPKSMIRCWLAFARPWVTFTAIELSAWCCSVHTRAVMRAQIPIMTSRCF